MSGTATSGGGTPAKYEFVAVAPSAEALEPRAVRVSGSLPTTIIVRIVRQVQPAFRACYENRTSPSAAGVVAARFTIVADGTVRSVTDDGSDFPEDGVVKCVLHVFEGLAFPQPGDGVVTVVYPIELPPRSR